jgi:hypothetical protein
MKKQTFADIKSNFFRPFDKIKMELCQQHEQILPFLKNEESFQQLLFMAQASFKEQQILLFLYDFLNLSSTKAAKAWSILQTIFGDYKMKKEIPTSKSNIVRKKIKK